MYHQLKNEKGELLYTIALLKLGNYNPSVYIKTWERAMEYLDAWTSKTKEKDLFHRQIIYKDIIEDNINRRANALIRECRKGTSEDNILSIKIEPAYTD